MYIVCACIVLVQCFEPQGRHFTNFHYYYGTYIDTLTFSASGSLFFLMPRMSAPPNSDTPPIGFFFPLKQETSSVLWQEQATRKPLCVMTETRNQFCVLWQKPETSSVCYDRNWKPILCVIQKQETCSSVCYDRNRKLVLCVMTETGKHSVC